MALVLVLSADLADECNAHPTGKSQIVICCVQCSGRHARHLHLNAAACNFAGKNKMQRCNLMSNRRTWSAIQFATRHYSASNKGLTDVIEVL